MKITLTINFKKKDKRQQMLEKYLKIQVWNRIILNLEISTLGGKKEELEKIITCKEYYEDNLKF